MMKLRSGVPQVDALAESGITREQAAIVRSLALDCLKIGAEEADVFSSDECRNLVSPRAWNVIRELVFQRDLFLCQYCFETAKRFHCDHIMPLARGGRTVPNNLITACGTCNTGKRDKLLIEWWSRKAVEAWLVDHPHARPFCGVECDGSHPNH